MSIKTSAILEVICIVRYDGGKYIDINVSTTSTASKRYLRKRYLLLPACYLLLPPLATELLYSYNNSYYYYYYTTYTIYTYHYTITSKYYGAATDYGRRATIEPELELPLILILILILILHLFDSLFYVQVAIVITIKLCISIA